MTKKTKAPEIERLTQFMAHEKLTAAELAAQLDMPYRTITNYLWSDQELSGRFLKTLHRAYAVSIDWLVSGTGEMLCDDRAEDDLTRPLIAFKSDQELDVKHLADAWRVTARTVEMSLIEAGAIPGQDYSLVDLYRLSGPFVLELFKRDEMIVDAPEHF